MYSHISSRTILVPERERERERASETERESKKDRQTEGGGQTDRLLLRQRAPALVSRPHLSPPWVQGSEQSIPGYIYYMQQACTLHMGEGALMHARYTSTRAHMHVHSVLRRVLHYLYTHIIYIYIYTYSA